MSAVVFNSPSSALWQYYLSRVRESFLLFNKIQFKVGFCSTTMHFCRLEKTSIGDGRRFQGGNCQTGDRGWPWVASRKFGEVFMLKKSVMQLSFAINYNNLLYLSQARIHLLLAISKSWLRNDLLNLSIMKYARYIPQELKRPKINPPPPYRSMWHHITERICRCIPETIDTQP